MRVHLLARPAAALALAAVVFLQPDGGAGTAQAMSYSRMPTIQKHVLSGLAEFELNPANAPIANNAAMTRRNYFPTGDDGCTLHVRDNVKVNQNCENVSDPDLAGRGQAQNETSIAQDPFRPEHIVASFNDYRRGDGNCYGAYSLDGGRSWTDTTIPMSFTRGTAFGAARQYWQSGGDTAVAWDTKGNAYFQCQVFNRGRPPSTNPDLSSAVYVFRSTQNFGASWNFPGRPVIESADLAGSGAPPFEDKPYMTVDNHAGSPYQDRVYVTYTEFTSDGTAYIYESYSADYGQTFSPRHLVSIASPLCVNTYGLPTAQGGCNENQYSQPFTGPDGALYVVYNNFNNAVKDANDNRNQILLAKSTDGGNTFSAPVKVADYFDLPDCATYQGGKDFGRACVPEKGPTTNSIFRATNYSSGAVDPRDAKKVVVALGSYINVHSNEANGCVPTGFSPATGANLYSGVKTPGGCNNDILLSVSDNGGASFTGTTTDPRLLTTATTDPRQATTDQYWQWIAFTKDGKLAVSYFDRQYGDDETTGFSDISLSGARSLRDVDVVRVTSSSMPPPTQFSGLFYGDYSGLTAVNDAYPLWMDTRDPEVFVCPGTATAGSPPALCEMPASNAAVANDQDIFTSSVGVPGR